MPGKMPNKVAEGFFGIMYATAKQACSDHFNVKSQLYEGSASTLLLKKPKKLE